ncbi:class I SAM-dependent methyltransferase [Stenotrophomonas oahuensis]|uniref:Class I SAM-dependent methyltransferase n=1 Tax=Stenotrophomonas oahuensis TaxID=3003271 RepID=A0ABY9YIS3_9GAMM|nr:class I SAM-dependent methyltransferase [Stenotrophomonas sp. A5586]WNH50786.1 class I SAM-dependent methyltransferase [Stenotrophomonas sp. A5586]
MAQITSGIRSILSHPIAYDGLQGALGVTNARRTVCEEYIKASEGQVVVDVGCGTAEILKFLPGSIQYFGFDLSQSYIDSAQRRFGDRGTFRCADVTALSANEIPPCQVAVSFGVLHHLDDDGARHLIEGLYDRLAPGGRLITVDPAFVPGQARIARELIKRDRGQNVRNCEGYLDLVSPRFQQRGIEPRHDLLRVPYTYAVMTCVR